MKHISDLFKVTNGHLMKNSRKHGSVSIYHRNIQSLAIEMLQIKHGTTREIVTDIFKTDNAGIKFQKKLRFYGTFFEHSVSWFY